MHFHHLGEAIDLREYHASSVAGCLKLYLRQLPNPLIPLELYQLFMKAAGELFLLLQICTRF